MSLRTTTSEAVTQGSQNAAGQPDTPLEVLTDLLATALQCQDSKQQQMLIQKAHAIAAGVDPYLDKISTPASQVHIGLHETTVPLL